MTDDRTRPSAQDLAICAHDLRGALTVIAGYTALLGRDDLTATERAEAVDGIDAAIRRADALVTKTLEGAGADEERGEAVDLAQVALRAAADARAAHGREIRVEAASGVRVRGDEQALTRMLENLLGNAAKYALAGPIDVVVLGDGEHAVLQVLDRGPGIPEDSRESVLEPFTRLERDAEKPGSGLGLTAVTSVAERHGGRVTISARDGGGAAISVTFPAARD